MPIKVQCACGKAFAAKDELAGKTVKCPGCQKPLKIPGAAASPAAGAAKAAAKPAVKPAAAAKPAAAKPAASKPTAAKQPAAPVGGDDGMHLFDEVGLQAAAEGTHPCPGCTEPMPIEAVVCVKCGYNTRIGRRMETQKDHGAGGPEGHGGVAQGLLNRAAAVIDEDAAEEKKKGSEGFPWWAYVIILSALIGLATWMLFNWGVEKPEEDKKSSLPNAPHSSTV